MWDDLLELVRMEALRLGRTYPLGDTALILRSDDGWHIRFPMARLTKAEEESIMRASMGHSGYVWFSCLIHDTTLRASRTPARHSHEPYLREIIKLR